MMDQIPNVISVLRLFLIVPIAYGILYGRWAFVLVMLVIAGLTDLLDGYVARRFDWTSRFGEIVDPIADKVTFGGACILLTLVGIWPVWLLCIVLAREGVIVGGAAAYKLLFKSIDIEPTLLSKANTIILVSVIVLTVVAQIDFEYQEIAASGLEWWGGYGLVALFSIASGIDYVRLWGRRAFVEHKKQNSTDSSVLP
ncbi:MAG: CDP-alcohol phosphatidyltransferase family protein [Gammaproteobacteria bacterium]|nr:CDP-alcohol phosphatidyltransferase family protein [Gammaproteobacteria bacterium]MYF38088.1 CDP-alcohol phosphatidyltransferase family protein [Gammaproteobacteria bacterium]